MAFNCFDDKVLNEMLPTPTPFSVEDICHRLTERATVISLSGDHTLNRIRVKTDAANWKQAAVLIPIIKRRHETNLLLTLRASNLRDHSGQIAFPGGKIEASDKTPEAAAMREAYEEVSLREDDIQIIGSQPYYYTSTGYEIRPILALVTEQAKFDANPEEVAGVFEVPMRFLMNPENHQLVSKVIRGQNRSFYAMPFQNHYIWGATAGMIRALYERLYA